MDRRHRRNDPGRRAGSRGRTLLHRRLPGRLRHVLAGALFLLFGLWLLLDGALGWRTAGVAVTATVGLAVLAGTSAWLRRRQILPSQPR